MAPRIGGNKIWTDSLTLAQDTEGGIAVTMAGEIAADGDTLFGVTEYGGLEGESVNVIRAGTWPVQIADDCPALAVGDNLGVTTGGKFTRRNTAADLFHGQSRSTTLGTSAEEADMDLLTLIPAVVPA